MTLVATLIREKIKNKDVLLKKHCLKDKKLPIGIIKLNQSIIDETLVNALKILPANFIIISNNEILWDYLNIGFSDVCLNDKGLDFIVCDDCESNPVEYFKNGIIPIIYKSNHMSSVLTEFNAARVEWNAFIFENDALCDIYYAIIRYLENYKFPYDNKALVKNILDI